MDDITFVRSHWWLVSEGFSLSTANSDVQKLPPLCTIVLQIPSLMPLKMRKVQLYSPSCISSRHTSQSLWLHRFI